MKNAILNICRWALAALGISGVVSCDGDGGIDPTPEYGVPVMDFRVQGKVLSSESNKPIKGIAVTGIIEDNYERKDTVWTANNGEFVYSGMGFPSESILLKFSDVDGTDNQGEFQTQKVTVQLTRQEESQDGWYVGMHTADDVTVKLDPVKPE